MERHESWAAPVLNALQPMSHEHEQMARLAAEYVHASTVNTSPFVDMPFIRNVQTKPGMLPVGEYVFPMTIDDGEVLNNSYVVSPLTAYSGYAEAELARLPALPILSSLLRGLIRGAGHYIRRRQLGRVVHVNNWMLSTNLYPADWDGTGIVAMTDRLASEFPDHAICLRSLNRFSNRTLLDTLERQGYLLTPSRQVYLFDARTGEASNFLKHNNVKSDARLLKKTPYQEVSGTRLTDKDFVRLEQLYRMLYIDKYCALNPQYTARWLYCGQRDGWLSLTALRHPGGQIDGVVGWFALDNVLTAPIVGYDTSLPATLGLYRLLTRLCLQEAVTRRVVLNFSAGAGHFKRLRGGVPQIEYSAIYVRHLSAERRRAWRVLAALLQSVAVPVMRTFKL